MHLHETARQRQSDAQAAARPFETRLGLLEHVEDAGKDVRGNTNPRVAYPHHRLTGLLVPVERDAAAARRELHRIVEDVRKDLHEAGGIAVDMDGGRRRADIQRVLGRRGQRHDGLESRLHQPREIVRLTAQLNLVGRDP